MSRDSAARDAYLSEVREAFGQDNFNIVPQLASLVLPKVVAYVSEHIKKTPITSPCVAGELHLPPAASTSAPAGLSSDLPAGADEEVWPPLKDVCTGCGEEFSTEFGIRHCS